jgi:hypothetical protein
VGAWDGEDRSLGKLTRDRAVRMACDKSPHLWVTA